MILAWPNKDFFPFFLLKGGLLPLKIKYMVAPSVDFVCLLCFVFWGGGRGESCTLAYGVPDVLKSRKVLVEG